MITISLCMIVRNEEDTLARCLNSIKDVVDEIIIVDTGSSDNTKEIAKTFTDKIMDFQWIDDFSAARNYAFQQATQDYILWLDADDVLLDADQIKFIHLKKELDPSVDIVMMKYNTGFDEKGNVTFSYYRERLSRRCGNYKWCEPIHEYLQIAGKIINVDIAITHKKIHPVQQGRNIKIYEKMISQGKELSPRGLYYYARELKDNDRIEDAIEYFHQFLQTKKGWVEDNINACHTLSKCYEKCNMIENILPILFKSFEYDLPRGEICCEIGYYFKRQGDHHRAIFWFELATKLKKPENTWGFIMHDYWDYIPYMELCTCYYAIKRIDKSLEYHQKAEHIKPDSPQVVYNRQFFKKNLNI
ncbi:MAG: glycosyltransferase [Eubacteriales bacterium]